MILMYSHLIIADWELTLWYRKQLWGTFHYAIRVLFCKISQFLYCFAKFKFFLKGSSWWNNWAGNCLLGRYWPQVKSKFKMPLQLAMAFWITMQCNARAICFFQIQSIPLIVETTREPRSILPLAPILQRHLPTNASLNIEVGQQRVISLKVLPQSSVPSL